MDLQEQFEIFMEVLDKRCLAVGVNLSNHCIDHICRRVETNQEFVQDKKHFVKMSKIYAEGPFHHRTFCIFLLEKPLRYKDHKVRFVEFPQPGGNGIYSRGFQHVEVMERTLLEGLDFGQRQDYHAFISYGGKVCVQWPDLMALKVTTENLFAKALTEDHAELKWIEKVG